MTRNRGFNVAPGKIRPTGLQIAFSHRHWRGGEGGDWIAVHIEIAPRPDSRCFPTRGASKGKTIGHAVFETHFTELLVRKPVGMGFDNAQGFLMGDQ